MATSTSTSGAQAGRFKYRVRLERPKREVLDTGEPRVAGWEPVPTPRNDGRVWAAISPMSGREWLASQEWRPQVTTRITIRWRNDITTANRVIHGDTIYNIEAVIPNMVANRPDLMLMCTSGVITEGGQP
ncbi:phage head closure protein [Paraburkholderia adhaesiva]|uniref:phage head closure protein n=1 Tax=Paraburkholderia adhaesiva TaxID=2883244 RepID=UPI001F1ECD19|nr:phage head closure protein [Paraburkholderia adhaesiva]